jgi:hypothetical protein
MACSDGKNPVRAAANASSLRLSQALNIRAFDQALLRAINLKC